MNAITLKEEEECGGPYQSNVIEVRIQEEEDALQQKKNISKLLKTERELKRLAFDNKKFNLDASDAGFICVGCGSTFLYDVQLQSHSVYAHLCADAGGASAAAETAGTLPRLNYRCTVCSNWEPTIQAYLHHVQETGCRSEKRRLKALDSCVCLLCGHATTRNQLHTHLRDAHKDLPPLAPTNSADEVFACPMCTLDGGSVVVASSNDLLLHLSTWHPTAVLAEKASDDAEDYAEEGGSGDGGDTREREQGRAASLSKSSGGGRRLCYRCRTYIPNAVYFQHRRKCRPKPPENVDLEKNKRLPKPKKVITKRIQTTAKAIPSSSKVISRTFATATSNLQAFDGTDVGRDDSAVEPSSSQQEPLPEQLQQVVEEASEPPPREELIHKMASTWARVPKVWKKPYNCLNCRKEFPEALSCLIHSVSKFCQGNREMLMQSLFCPLCKEGLKTAHAVVEHLRRRHCDWDGLRVDKAIRIEFNELAAEIIGYRHVCSKCGRGFHAKSRCNPIRPHLGSKVPIQQILICNLCNRRVKSAQQLTLHLWAMHNFVTDTIDTTVTSGLGRTAAVAPASAPTPEASARLESISSGFVERTQETVRSLTYDPDKEVPSLLKCSACTTRFASLAALSAHNKEFHESPRRDDRDFQLLAKVFFYRQSETCWNDERSLFDDLFVAGSGRAGASSVAGSIDVLPVEKPKQRIVEPVERKRKRLLPANNQRATKASTSSQQSDPGSAPPLPTTSATTLLPMPRLVRIPKMNSTTVSADNGSTFSSFQQHFPPNVCISSVSSLASQPPPNLSRRHQQQNINTTIWGLRPMMPQIRLANMTTANMAPIARVISPAVAPNGPVLVRAYSLRPEASKTRSAAPPPQPHYVIASGYRSIRPVYNNNQYQHNAVFGAPSPAIAEHPQQTAVVSGLRSFPAPRVVVTSQGVRCTTAPLVIRMISPSLPMPLLTPANAGASTASMPMPGIRAVKRPSAEDIGAAPK